MVTYHCARCDEESGAFSGVQFKMVCGGYDIHRCLSCRCSEDLRERSASRVVHEAKRLSGTARSVGKLSHLVQNLFVAFSWVGLV